MARAYVTGNYFFLDLETTNGILSDSVSSVRVWEKVGNSEIWVIESDLLGQLLI